MMTNLMDLLGGGAGNRGNPPVAAPMPVRSPMAPIARPIVQGPIANAPGMPVRGTLATAPNQPMPQMQQSPFSVGSWLNWRHPNGGF
jgi:hypothetical protein